MITNKFVCNQDAVKIHSYIVTSKLTDDYAPTYWKDRGLWNKLDCFCKWGSLLMMFDEIEQPDMRVVDLGVGEGPVPHVISNKGHDVSGVDNMRIDHPFKTSLVQMVLRDAKEFLTDLDEESVDVFIDSCSVTHFEFDRTSNIGWEKVLSASHSKLKSGGYFIISSDTHLIPENKRTGEFLIPEEIVSIAKNVGYDLPQEYVYSRVDAIRRTEGGETDLGVANFMFVKK